MKIRKRILRLQQVQEATGLSRTSLYRLMASDEFPQSISLGGRAVGWVESEVFDWIDSRIAARTVA